MYLGALVAYPLSPHGREVWNRQGQVTLRVANPVVGHSHKAVVNEVLKDLVAYNRNRRTPDGANSPQHARTNLSLQLSQSAEK